MFCAVRIRGVFPFSSRVFASAPAAVSSFSISVFFADSAAVSAVSPP